jgi:two-component system, NarL family, sensor histidine kinase UhpB
MSLRLKINLIVGLLTVAFVAGVLALQVGNMRDSVKEEVVAANRVASQMLNRMAWLYAAQGTPAMLGFLQGMGRVRSNDITLLDATGHELYQSPPSPYKQGLDAPGWFERLIAPAPSTQVFEFPDGKLVVRANASRAALDNWEYFVKFTESAAVLLVLVNLLVSWVVGRTVRPFGRIVEGLGELQAGRFDVVLPPLPGTEAAAIGAAFNRMTGVLRENIETERRALLAERRLSDSRELTRWIDHHVEQERRMIARELHDELGQSVTAIRSLALSVAQRVEGRDAESEQAARLIASESSRLYDAMHGLIPRLAPLVLDTFGLGDALADLAERTRRAHAAVRIDLRYAPGDAQLSPEAALALYRAAQEGITNAIRHGQAQQLDLAVQAAGGTLALTLVDDGKGLADGWEQKPGHHGLRWPAERVEGLKGRFSVAPAPGAGVCLRVELPLAAT